MIEISLSQLNTSKALTEWLVTVKNDKSMFSSSQSELRVIEISLLKWTLLKLLQNGKLR